MVCCTLLKQRHTVTCVNYRFAVVGFLFFLSSVMKLNAAAYVKAEG